MQKFHCSPFLSKILTEANIADSKVDENLIKITFGFERSFKNELITIYLLVKHDLIVSW